jgi:hypothetical protein
MTDADKAYGAVAKLQAQLDSDGLAYEAQLSTQHGQITYVASPRAGGAPVLHPNASVVHHLVLEREKRNATIRPVEAEHGLRSTH